MSKIEEAYELAVMGRRPEGAPEGIYEGQSEEEQADAVRAAMMVAHVGACEKRHDACHVCCTYDAPCPCEEVCACVHSEGKADNVFSQDCGDGWLCNVAKEIEALR